MYQSENKKYIFSHISAVVCTCMHGHMCTYGCYTLLGACFMAAHFHAHQTKTTATCAQAVSIDGDM